MNGRWRLIFGLLYSVLLWLSLSGCSDDSPWRFSPGVPSSPTALAATAGNGQVSLSWTPPTDAAALTADYTVYYATSPGVTPGNATKIEHLTGTSFIVTGLSNDVTYFFAVAAHSSSGESALSNEVSATPSAPGSFQQSDLQGTWYFNGLAGGPASSWVRGSVAIDGAGNVSINAFLDSTGNTTAPAGFFGSLSILPDGVVLQGAGGTAADFHGVLSANQFKDMLVGTASNGGSTPILVVLQKRVPGITFTSSDIKGTGRLVAGPLLFVYHQLASGANPEWEVASCQVGQDQSETYSSINGPTPRQLPGAGNKVVSISITPDGLVSETPLPGVQPQPAALLSNAVMSADKMTIVGTATAAGGASVLRVIQLIHPPAVTLPASYFAPADLAGTYAFHDLTAGAVSSWAHGNLVVDLSGTLGVTSYLDSTGGTTLPAPFTVTMDQQGELTSAAAPSYRGKLSYFKDMVVATGTDAGGAYRLSIELKR